MSGLCEVMERDALMITSMNRLPATELDLATLSLGGFVDSEFNEILRVAATEQGAVYVVAVGTERSSDPTE